MAAPKTAVITGAAGGIGGAIAAGFRAAGFAVIAVDRVDSAGITALDVADAAAVAAFAAGVPSLDVLVNAAGINRRTDEYDPAVFASVMDVNLMGTAHLCLALRPALLAANGCVINVASMYAFFGAPHAPAYAASKGAVAQLTKSLAVAWAKDGIRVNALAPGWIDTAMTGPARADADRNRAILERTPMGRWGTPDDLVGPALFLAGDAARFVTGAILPVDGGYAVM